MHQNQSVKSLDFNFTVDNDGEKINSENDSNQMISTSYTGKSAPELQ